MGDEFLDVVDDMKIIKLSERSMTQYFFEDPDMTECRGFILKNQAGRNRFYNLFLKLRSAFTHNKYFESLFPTIKEQKPGMDLYAPMVIIQVLIIIFLILFYTRMDPDYANVTSEDLTPSQFNSTMVLAVFLQIIIIVFDRYLYLSRDYVVIDEVEIEEDDEEEDDDLGRTESLSQFERVKTIDLRSSSATKFLCDIGGKKRRMKGKGKQSKDLDEFERDEGDQFEVQLSKIRFNRTLLLKYYLQLGLLVFIHMTFWYFPIRTNIVLLNTPFCTFYDPLGNQCNEVFMNWTLVVFYLLYCSYFAISAMQIRYGLPELRKGNFAMGDYTPINKGVFQGYLAAPFILELKILSDWTFTKTALDLFQWIKFETIYGDLFIAKCTNKGYINHPLGEKIPWYMKLILGFGGLLVLILIIAGPLLLFSSFNPLAQANPVIGARLRFQIATNLTIEDGGATNKYELFRSDRFLSIGDIPNPTFNTFNGIRQITSLDRDLFQQVMFENVSDSTWTLSPPIQTRLHESLVDSKNSDGINLILSYEFQRDQPPDQLTISKELPIINILAEDVVGGGEILQALISATGIIFSFIFIDPDFPCRAPNTDIG